MRQNAAQLNRMQIREQEALNRQRRQQDDAATRREEEAVRRTQAQYNHVTSHGYGRGGAASSPSPATAAPSSAASPLTGSGATRRSGLNSNVSHGDDVQIKVYVRECDDHAGETFVYKESGAAAGMTGTSGGVGAPGRGPRGPASAALPAPANPRAAPARQSGSGGTRSPATTSAAANTSASKGGDLVAPNRARVPLYLQQRKAEMAAEKAALAAEAERQRQLSQIPPGHRRVSDAEKADTLRQVEERQQELEAQLAKIPIRFDTQSIQQRRRAIEEELRELEVKRNKYSTKNPLYVPLSQ